MQKSTIERIETLRNIPLFSNLTMDELYEAHDFFVEESRRKGEVICRVGEEGDTFYVVISGELEVWGGEGEHTKLVGRLGPRDFFGELALVVGGPRSATVTVSRQTRLLALNKESFQRFFLKNAKALEFFSREICRRLATTVANDLSGEAATKVIAVVAEQELQGSTMVAASLACLLSSWTADQVLLARVERLDENDSRLLGERRMENLTAGPDEVKQYLERPRDQPATLAIGIDGSRDQAETSDHFASLVSRLCPDFDFIVLDIGPEPASLVASATRYADVMVDVRSKVSSTFDPIENSLQRLDVLNLFNRGTRRVNINSCEPFVIPRDESLPANARPLELGNWVKQNPRSRVGIPLHRLARKVLGRSVGLALGGGAAFGLAHLGVIKVFEDNGLPIDLIAGCSMGSLVAIGYSAGVSCSDLIEMAGSLGSKSKLLRLVQRDSTMTRPGMLTGDGLKETFLPYLGDRRTFKHLQLPCRAVATDIESGERVTLGSGDLATAFRASCSVPVVMAPVRVGKRVLVDGGVCDPVPAEVVREMGADLCIAVNVVPPLKKGVVMLPSRVYRRLNYFNPLAYFGESLSLPNLFDIAMNSMQTLQYELGNFKAISADVRINPDLSDFTWIEFYRHQELIARGVEAAERALPAIRRALDGNSV